MPSGVYIRTKPSSNRGKHNSIATEFKKGNIPWWKKLGLKCLRELKNEEEKNCLTCSQIFTKKMWNHKFCSKKCQRYYTNKMLIKKGYFKSSIQRDNNKKAKKKYYEKNKEKPEFRLNNTMGRALSRGLKNGKEGEHWEKLTGFNKEQLKKHLEKQFKYGMNWKNYGTKWQIDHRIPLSLFKFSSIHDQGFKSCWELENLQPKIKEYNIRKGNHYSEPTLSQVCQECDL